MKPYGTDISSLTDRTNSGRAALRSLTHLGSHTSPVRQRGVGGRLGSRDSWRSRTVWVDAINGELEDGVGGE